MRKTVLWTLFQLFFVYNVFAQSPTTFPTGLKPIIPPSPTVAALQKYGDIPVSPYTGVPEISIPLHQLKFHDINLPISLNYHASGIKVGEEASNVGLGWSLSAGGVISRTILGEDDFRSTAYFTSQANVIDMVDGKKPFAEVQTGQANGSNLAKYRYVDPSGNIQELDLTTPLQLFPKVDFEPDQYNFNLPGLSGKFTLRRDRTALLEKQQNIDITVNATGDIWQIKSVDGFTYDFTQVENTHERGSSLYKITAIYLTKITSPTGHVVNFVYTVDNDNQVAPVGSYTQTQEVATFNIPNSIPFTSPMLGGFSQQNPGQLYNSVRLNYIECDNQKIIFDFTNTRTDVSYDNKLNSIRVFIKDSQGNLSGLPIKKFDLAYDYFDGSSDANDFGVVGVDVPLPYRQRLKLLSVTQTGYYKGQTLTDRPYRFTYYEGFPNNNLPAKSSFGRDHWGYYNGQTQNTLIPSFNSLSTQANGPDGRYSTDIGGIMGNERDANGLFMQAFSLSDIQYPSGGSTHFDYEANECDEDNSLINDMTVFPAKNTEKQSTNFDPATHGKWVPGNPTDLPTFDATDANALSQHANISIGVLVNSSNVTSLSGLKISLYNGTQLMYDILPNDRGQVHSMVLNCSQSNISFAPGMLHFVVDPGGNESKIQSIVINLSWRTKVTSKQETAANGQPINCPTYSQVGGLRIKRIIDRDGINPERIKRFIYNYQQDRGAGLKTYSYGRRMSKPEYRYFQRSNMSVLQRNGNVSNETPYVTEHLIQVSDSNVPLNGSAQGNVVGYDQVTILEGENGENGKTVNWYYNQSDIVPAFLWNYYPRQRPQSSNIADPMNGNLLRSVVYRNNGNQFIPVKETVNSYIAKTLKTNDMYGFSAVITPHGKWDADASAVFGGYKYDSGDANNLFSSYITLRSQQIVPEYTIERIYDQRNPLNSHETRTEYFYDSNNHYFQTKQQTYNSQKEKLTTIMSYPLDYASLNTTDPISKGIINVKSKHVYNTPIETIKTKTSADGNTTTTVAGSIIAFDSSVPLPATIYQLQTVSPINGFTPLTINSTNTIKNSAYQSVVSFDYDPLGNIIRQSKAYGPNMGYKWAYHAELPIVEVKNADNTEFYFEGFEDNPSATSGNAHTGNRFISGPFTVNWTKAGARSYILNYWFRTGDIWKYSGDQPYLSNSFTLNGGDAYDDIRIYPVDAQMTALTYDQEIGVISNMDPKGLVSSFEYDGLRRLINIKDQNGSIIKNYKYYLNDAAASQPVYYNVAMQKTLQRTCTGDYKGTLVTYVVPYGKYSSTISQDAANQQAMNDLTSNQIAYANTNSSCVIPVFYNEEMSGSYKANCQTDPSVSGTFTYTVPFGKYTGATLAAANAQAKNDLDTNGPTIAANSLVCPTATAKFITNDQTGLGTYAANLSGANSVFISIPAGTSERNVPPGTYTVQISTVGTQIKTFSLGGTTITGRTATFTNVAFPLNGSVTLTIN